MSRIVAGKVRLEVRPIALADVVNAALEAESPAARAKGVRLEKTLDPVAGLVSGDPNRLQQVVWNLLANAVKFTPGGGKVRVALQSVDSHVEVRVTDTGKGITPDFLPHVFERFRQEDASTTRKHGGLGLGLSIVKHLVELHGGSVRASSPGEGLGATFTIALPLSAPTNPENERERQESTGAPREPADFQPPDLRGVKVLVVDDDVDSREVIGRMLGESGATILTAASAAEGLETLRRERPDVLVSDVGMPEMDGYEFARRIRALPPIEGGVVVLLTPNSIDREWVKVEVGAAWGKRKHFRIVAIMCHVDTVPIPALIKERKALDLNQFDEYLRELKERAEGSSK